ncbi:hypothetical protein J5N97_025635 [Dioscorea zingiberensis]|uniref:Nucleosome assembly protein 1 n=1 Tax=Dioscorea zingiberensis TaxID=325984 RepID=A0A9D5C1T8_9LILI|nr:hypothetical protein J5N97_025635 [Dioscorea zingiberensis]
MAMAQILSLALLFLAAVLSLLFLFNASLHRRRHRPAEEGIRPQESLIALPQLPATPPVVVKLAVEDGEQRGRKRRGRKNKLEGVGSGSDGGKGEACEMAVRKDVKDGLEDCMYPFSSSASATQRKIKMQYDQLVKSNQAKSLTMNQVGQFVNCLVRPEMSCSTSISDIIQRSFKIKKALLFKADRSSFDRLCQQLYKLEAEHRRLEEDATVYNLLQEQLKLSPAYKTMLEIGTSMELKDKLDQPTDFPDISFEELLAQEKKDSFWLRNELSAEDRADLVNSLKNKLQSLVGQHADVLESLPPTVRKRVDVLREIQSQHGELEAKFFEERAALEAKYQKLYEPLYTKRYEIVNGVVEVESVKTETTEETAVADKSNEEKGVPDFWLTAMKTNEVLAEEKFLFGGLDPRACEAALKYLKDIKWYRIENPKGFKLEFYFDTNPFFKNSILTKTYHMIDDDEPILEKAIGTEIEWYPGKCLTQKVLKKKPKKGSKNAKPITKTEGCESFFNFFSPPQVPEEDEDIDEEAAEQLQSQMEQDYDVGSTIRDKMIPHAVSWFTGEAVQGDDFENLGDDDVMKAKMAIWRKMMMKNQMKMMKMKMWRSNPKLVGKRSREEPVLGKVSRWIGRLSASSSNLDVLGCL